MVDLFVLSPGDRQLVGDVLGKVLSRCLHHVAHPLGRLPRDAVEPLHRQLEKSNLVGGGRRREVEAQVQKVHWEENCSVRVSYSPPFSMHVEWQSNETAF